MPIRVFLTIFAVGFVYFAVAIHVVEQPWVGNSVRHTLFSSF